MARFLTWEEVIRLPEDKKVWIQYSNYELIYDSIRYIAQSDDILQDYQMSVHTKASQTYRRAWVIWDKMPTEEQFFGGKWRIQ